MRAIKSTGWCAAEVSANKYHVLKYRKQHQNIISSA